MQTLVPFSINRSWRIFRRGGGGGGGGSKGGNTVSTPPPQVFVEFFLVLFCTFAQFLFTYPGREKGGGEFLKTKPVILSYYKTLQNEHYYRKRKKTTEKFNLN